MINETVSLPIVPLRNAAILPGMIVHFDIARKASIKAVEKAMLQDQVIFLTSQKEASIEEPVQEQLNQIGTISYIKQLVKMPRNMIRVLVEGTDKARLITAENKDGFLQGTMVRLEEDDISNYDPAFVEAFRRILTDSFEQYSVKGDKISKKLFDNIMKSESLEDLISNISINLPLTWQTKQRFLDAENLKEKVELLTAIMNNEVQVIDIKQNLQRKIKAKIDKNQKEYILREQLKVIKEELGEDNSSDSEAKEYLSQLEKLDAPEEIKKNIEKEIERFKTTNNHAAESNVSRNYIETLLKIPWNKKTEDKEDLSGVWDILEEQHYGLRDVKERIMEFLSVRHLTKKGKSPILCLVGPPGTGKTSIAKSVAEALDKKYARLSLGGVRDEAEIRGHRRTYVGAIPGTITQALINVGVSNPLLLLDEIDKTSSNHNGDVASALLEVLDPEQNRNFRDHYVDMPQDLSDVLFIATANSLQGIPRPLLDRMELIEISGYTENEKLHIAKEHLIPKQIKENGIEEIRLKIQTQALKKMINNYTKEAGVRALERAIGKICRKSARMVLEDHAEKISVTTKNLSEFLGRERYSYLMANKKNEVGIVRGLAWTQVGGDTLEIEVSTLPGKGEIILTGQLGDVMKESAMTGIAYIRSIAEEYSIDDEFFKNHEIHLHIPEGAVPKDGPSAGITMATAILSAAAKIPVRSDLAMTGEITLRGRVLPIGGLKEKLLAAKYAGIKEVLVPKANKSDVKDMDSEITDGLKISYMETMHDVLSKALVR